MSIRLVTVDEHALLRLGLTGAAAEAGDIDVVGEAASAAQALRVTRAQEPDVVSLELALPDHDGIQLALQLRELLPDVGLVLLTAVRDDGVLFRALDAGLSAYVPKSAGVLATLSAIRHAAAAPHSFSAPGLSAALHSRQQSGGLLSHRERQVLELMREGLSVHVIADELGVGGSTVKTYVSRIYEKLHVRNRSQALMAALRMGLLPVEGTGLRDSDAA